MSKENENLLNLSDKEFLEKLPSLTEELNSFTENDGSNEDKATEDSLDNPQEDTSDKEESNEDEQENLTNADNSDDSTEDDDSKAQDKLDEEDEAIESQSDAALAKADKKLPDTSSTAEEPLDTNNKLGLDTKEKAPETTTVDYKSAYEKITAPFKANGVEMQVDNPEDIIKLMQMGANYRKKMSQLKPNLKIIKMLENNGLLNENKLHNLIDISKKDPNAIAKLVKDSGIDLLDFNMEGADSYKPTDYSISENEYNIDIVLESIKDTPEFDKTINVITKEWDVRSRAVIADNPDIISIINLHMSNGVFDKVNSILTKEKLLGNLANVSDVDAYYNIANHLAQTGELRVNNNNNSNKGIVNTPAQSPVNKTVTNTSSNVSNKQQATSNLNDKRKAAAISMSRTPAEEALPVNYLSMSDEEFLKQVSR